MNIYLSRKLRGWVAEGLVTGDQARAIREHEARTGQAKQWALYGIVAIGVVTIMTGTISLVAANWDDIPDFLKLGAYLLAHVGIALAFLRYHDRNLVASEGFRLAFALFFFVGIGLTAQIFHLSSSGWSGLMFWAALTLPVTLMAKTRPLPFLWIPVVLSALVIWEVSRAERLHNAELAAKDCFYLGLVPFALAAIGLLRRPRFTLPDSFREAMTSWGLVIVVAGGSIVGSSIWYYGGAKVAHELSKEASWATNLQFAPWVGAVIIGISLYASRRAYATKLAAGLTALALGAAAFTTLPLIFEWQASRIGGTAWLIAFWSVAAAVAVFADRKRLFDLITFAIAIRFIAVYFEVFGTMAATGIGLIISGAVILCIAAAWHRYRERLATWMKNA